MGKNEYFRNTEFSPVIVNQNTKTGTLELIDGYRRILTVSDPNLLDTTIPVKAYRDLSDNQFLSVLFAANMWKNDSSDRDIVAFDRGFLFALKQHFGFEIPEKAAQLERGMTYNGATYSSIPHELSLLYLYGNFGVEQMKNHSHYVDDIKMLYSTLLNCYFTEYPYDHQYNVELSKFITETVGKIREAEGKEPQSPLSSEIIESLFTDEYLTKLFSKKVYSSNTYVANFFIDKGVYKYVESKLREGLMQKETACDKDDEEEYEKYKNIKIQLKKTQRNKDYMNHRYGFLFYYDNDCCWCFVCFNENGSLNEYFTSDEDDHDKSISYIDLFLANGGNLYCYKFPTYKDFRNEINYIFSLKDVAAEELEKYRYKEWEYNGLKNETDEERCTEEI